MNKDLSQNRKVEYRPIRYYKKFKKLYLEFVLFVKFGEIYCTFDSDAKIVEYLLGRDYSESFKIAKIDFQKLVKKLLSNNLNVVLVGTKNSREYYSENESQYIKIRKKSKEYFKNKLD